MPEWTPEARQHLDQYLGRVAELCQRQGDDAEEVVANLREHVEAESVKDGGRLVTLDSLRTILARVGTPEQVTGSEPAGAAEPGKTDVARTVWDGLRTGRSYAFVLFVVVIPLAAILIEMAYHIFAEVWFDPIPTWAHVLILLTVPGSYAFGLFHLTRRLGERERRMTTLALLLNGFALAVSAVYLAVYLPVMPLAAIAIIAFGLGLLPLSPVLCTVGGALQCWRLFQRREFAGLGRGWAWRRWIAGAAVALVLLGALEGQVFLTDYALDAAISEDAEARARGVWLLRTVGGEADVLERCYGWGQRRGARFDPFGFDGPADRVNQHVDAYRQLYFRLTGRPYNSVPPPSNRPGSRSDYGWSSWRDQWTEEWMTDEEIGGEAVAARVRGVSLFASTLDVDIEHSDDTRGPGVACVEWTLEFKNATQRQREARTQIVLPRGGVASRLTLWIDGEEREAAFGTRLQVRKAYEEVAVVQRRDPALLTTAGVDRVLLQCFPIEPGKTMRVKVGVTAPLCVRAGKAWLRLPHFAERNFTIDGKFTHSLWAESAAKVGCAAPKVRMEAPGEAKHVVRGRLTERELLDPEQGSLALAAPEQPVAFEARLGTAAARMTWRPSEAKPPRAVCLVVDGSGSMAAVDIDWDAVCRALPASCKVGAVFAGQRAERWGETLVPVTPSVPRRLAEWISGQEFYGGCDPVPALEAAWDLVAGEREAVILWVHGPLPVRLSSPSGLLQRQRHRPSTPDGPDGVRILNLAVSPGPNRVIEDLGDPAEFEEVPMLGPAQRSLEQVAKTLRAEDGTRTYRLALGGAKLEPDTPVAGAASDQLVRLAVYDAVRRLYRQGAKEDLKKAARLAVSTRLVTPVSGAVVLETKEQYERHDLDPSTQAEPESVPGIPEPEEWALILVALAGFVYLLHRRRAQTVGGTQ